MASDINPIDLTLYVQADADADPDEVDRRARRLLVEIGGLEVESARLVPDAQGIPAGAKVAEAISLGTIAVSVLPTAVSKLVDFLQAWAARGQGQTVKIKAQQGGKAVEVEFSPRQVSPDDLRRYVDILTGNTSGPPDPH